MSELTPEQIKLLGQKVRERERKKVIGMAIGVPLIALLAWLGYKTWRGDFKFLLHETAHTNAVVVDMEWWLNGYNYYDQKFAYQYIIAGETYTQVTIIDKASRVQAIGDSLRVEYAVSDPNVHEIVW